MQECKHDVLLHSGCKVAWHLRFRLITSQTIPLQDLDNGVLDYAYWHRLSHVYLHNNWGSPAASCAVPCRSMPLKDLH